MTSLQPPPPVIGSASVLADPDVMQVNGVSEAAGTVTVFDGDQPVGTSPVDDWHNWLVVLDAPAVGEHTLTAVVEADGNPSPPSREVTVAVLPIGERPEL